MHVFTRNDYKILKNIITKDIQTRGNKPSDGSTVSEIADRVGLSQQKVRVTLGKLIEASFAAYGVKNGRTFTYVITPAGLKEIERVQKCSIK